MSSTTSVAASADPAATGVPQAVTGHRSVQQIEQKMARVEDQAKLFFDALQVSSTNVSQLGKRLLEEIQALENSLGKVGVTGLSLLVGSKDIDNEAAVSAKLKALEETILRNKEKERIQLHETTEVVQAVFRNAN